MKEHWDHLSERERWMVIGGLIFCGFYLFYVLIYSPLNTAIHGKTLQLQDKKETLVWMQQVKKQYKPQQPLQSLDSGQLLTVLAEQLNTAAFKPFPYQLQQIGKGDIQLIFERVPYNLFVEWLWSLSKKYAMTLQQFNIERTEISGIVKAMVVLSPLQR